MGASYIRDFTVPFCNLTYLTHQWYEATQIIYHSFAQSVYILDPNVFLTVLADFLAPDSAGPSADTVMAANASMYFFFLFFKVAQAIDGLEYILTEDTTWLQIVHVVSHGVETFQGLNN